MNKPKHPMEVIAEWENGEAYEDKADFADSLAHSVRHYFSPENIGEQSDGYHTFNELYRHRHLLFLSLCKLIGNATFLREHYPGWDAVTLQLPTGQISYHIPFEFRTMTLKVAAETTENPWDGHTSMDVMQRLFDFIEEENG
jgi:hypothetical protein